MYRLNGRTMELTRGDTARFKLNIKTNGEDFKLSEGDIIIFSVKKSTLDKQYVIQKEITDGNIIINPADTNELAFGNYLYDIQICYENGDVSTIIEPSQFRVCEEITTTVDID